MRYILISNQTVVTPVSYTHLDVYKRQPLSLNRSSPKTIGREYSTNQSCMQKIICCLLYTSRCV